MTGRLVIGRAPTADLTIDDRFLSSRHAALEPTNGDVTLTDLESANGTFVTGQRIEEPRALTPGELVEIGATCLEVANGTDTPAPVDGPVDPSVVPIAEPRGRRGLRRGRTSTDALDQAARDHERRLRAAAHDLATIRVLAATAPDELWSDGSGQPDASDVRVGWANVTSQAATATADDDVAERAPIVLYAVPVLHRVTAGRRVVVTGPAEASRALARAITLQLAAQLSPDHLRIDIEADDDWASPLAWLPHARGDAARARPRTLTVTDRAVSATAASTPDVDLHLRVTTGPVADTTADVIAIGEGGDITVTSSARGTQEGHAADGVTRPVAASLGRALARAAAARPDTTARPDAARPVRATALLGPGPLDPDGVLSRWYGSNSLDVPIGRTWTGDTVSVDVLTGGPHVLVQGAAGMGKSELLRAWVALACATHPPRHLNVVIIDDRGGGAWQPLRALPQVGDIVSGLDHGVRARLVAALAAELDDREGYLREHGLADLRGARSRGERDAPPYLVLVVDGLGDLANEHAAVVNALEAVARNGRRLGVHIVAACQASDDPRIPNSLRRNSPTTVAFAGASGGHAPGTREPGVAVLVTHDGPAQNIHTAMLERADPREPDRPVVVTDLVGGRPARDASPTRLLPATTPPTETDRLVAAITTAGQRVGEAAASAWLARRAAERPAMQTVVRTLLFTDIVGSTDLIEVIGDRAWSALIDWHDAALRARFADYDGHEIDHAGDGFFVSFETESAAVMCAVAIQRALEEHRLAHGFAPSVRIGVHHAELPADGTYRGRDVHAAARVGSAAEGGEILATTSTLDAAATDVRPTRVRDLDLKGLREPLTVASLEWER